MSTVSYTFISEAARSYVEPHTGEILVSTIQFFPGFSRVMTRPAGRVRSRPGSSRVGSGGVRNLTGRVGSDRVGSDRVGSGRVGSGRVGSGRVGRSSSSNLTGRVGSP